MDDKIVDIYYYVLVLVPSLESTLSSWYLDFRIIFFRELSSDFSPSPACNEDIRKYR